MTAGACGAFVGTPAEVALIRMTSDGNLAADQRRNYKSVFDALIRIFREEGITALWRGAIPTMGRAMVVNAAQLASYSQAKQSIMSTGYVDEGIFCHFLGKFIAGLPRPIFSRQGRHRHSGGHISDVPLLPLPLSILQNPGKA